MLSPGFSPRFLTQADTEETKMALKVLRTKLQRYLKKTPTPLTSEEDLFTLFNPDFLEVCGSNLIRSFLICFSELGWRQGGCFEPVLLHGH